MHKYYRGNSRSRGKSEFIEDHEEGEVPVEEIITKEDETLMIEFGEPDLKYYFD